MIICLFSQKNMFWNNKKKDIEEGAKRFDKIITGVVIGGAIGSVIGASLGRKNTGQNGDRQEGDSPVKKKGILKRLFTIIFKK